MEIYRIKSLDCFWKENRIKLVKEVMRALRLEEKPSKETLEKYCKKIYNKYKIGVKTAKIKENGKLQVNIETAPNSFSAMNCLTYYEALCKYILFAEAWIKYKNKCNKKN